VLIAAAVLIATARGRGRRVGRRFRELGGLRLRRRRRARGITADLVHARTFRAGAARGQADSADSVVAAIAILAENTIDVLVSDIGMPEHDGYALIRYIRASEDADKRGLPACLYDLRWPTRTPMASRRWIYAAHTETGRTESAGRSRSFTRTRPSSTQMT
jgi:CheY-like chemotaxis protein